MYRTLDTYTIKPLGPIYYHLVNSFSKLLEEHNLMADYRECFDVLSHGKFEFTTSCTYKIYKRFFFMFYQVFGPFTAEVSFNEDYPPEGCGYNTTVNFEVDVDGNYVFALVNVLAAGEDPRISKEYAKRRMKPNPPFEPTCEKKGKISDWEKSFVLSG